MVIRAGGKVRRAWNRNVRNVIRNFNLWPMLEHFTTNCSTLSHSLPFPFTIRFHCFTLKIPIDNQTHSAFYVSDRALACPCSSGPCAFRAHRGNVLAVRVRVYVVFECDRAPSSSPSSSSLFRRFSAVLSILRSYVIITNASGAEPRHACRCRKLIIVCWMREYYSCNDMAHAFAV